MQVKLKEIRVRKNITQKQLAKALGCTQVYISLLENGLKIPSLDFAFKVADFFNLKIEDIWNKTL